MKALKTEPVAVTGAIVAAYHAVVAYLLVAGIFHATAEQVATLEGAVVAVLAVPVTLLVRNAVTPMAKLSPPVASIPVPAGSQFPPGATIVPPTP